MIFEIPGAVNVDNHQILGNIRGNIVDKFRQFRVKFDCYVEGKSYPIDLVASEISWDISISPKLHLKGQEKTRKIFYDLTVKYSIVGNTASITGSAGGRQINKTLNNHNVASVLTELGKIFI